MKILAYTSPARGHLTPMMGPLLELRRRGAEVHVRTLAAGVDNVRAAGLEAEALAPAVEAIPHDDHEARVQITSGARSFATLRARARHEVPDFEAALDAVAPDVVLVDSTTFGAKAVAERRGLRWAVSQPSLIEAPAADGTPFGLGLRPLPGPLGTARDRALGRLADHFDQHHRLRAVNAGRRAARFLPHVPILRQADVVVCHGGMGITQKALAFGVPVCVVPWGRDQLDVAAHVVEAEAGTRISRRRLSPTRLATAVDEALTRRDGVARVKAGFEATGGVATAADRLEALAG